MNEIPRGELFLLALTAAEAEDLAGVGEEHAGMNCLETGLSRVQRDLAAEAWAAELQRRYDKAVQRFERRYLENPQYASR